MNEEINKEESEKKDIEEDKISQAENEDETNLLDTARQNPWIASTIILGLVVLIFIIGNITSSNVAGNVVSEEIAGEKLIDFVESTIQSDAELVEIKEYNDFLYSAVLFIEDENVPIFITKDGKNLVSGLMPLDVEVQQSSSKSNEVDWSVFENELPESLKEKILAFPESEKEQNIQRVVEFTNYEFIPNSLIVFYHEGCGWCTEYYSVLLKAKEENSLLNIYALDLGENRDLANKYGATGTPANAIYGKYFVSGYMPIEDLENLLSELNN